MDEIDAFFALFDDEPEPAPRKKNRKSHRHPTDPAVIAAKQKVSEAYARMNAK